MLPIGNALVPDPNDVYEVAIMNLDGSGFRQLTNDGKQKFLPHFSPDATKIVYTKFSVGGGLRCRASFDDLDGQSGRLESTEGSERQHVE